MAALIAIDTKQPAKRESDKKRATEFEREVASEGASEQSETISDTASDAEVFSTPASRICRTRKFTAYRNPITVGVAAFVSIAAVLSVAWHIRRSSIHSNRPSASTTQSRQHAVPSTGKSSPTGGSAVAIGTPMTADAPQRSNVVPDSAVSATPKVKASNGTLSSPKGALAQAKSGKLNELNAGEISRQKFCRNLCHPFLRGRKGSTWTGLYNSSPCSWKAGTCGGKPNVWTALTATCGRKSGGAMDISTRTVDGKPTATHIVLTVQFQR